MRALDKETQFAAAVEQHRDALYRVCCAYVRDEADRQGITEIRYIEGLYAMWDELRARHPGLVIDLEVFIPGRRPNIPDFKEAEQALGRSYGRPFMRDTGCCR